MDSESKVGCEMRLLRATRKEVSTEINSQKSCMNIIIKITYYNNGAGKKTR